MTTPTDIIRQAISSELTAVHTCLPAKIVKYDYTLQKANVQPLLNRRYKDGTPQGNIQPLPEITNVPVVFPRTSAFSMHYPLNEGDNVMLLFSERSLDQWLTNGGQITPSDPRKFDLSDAIAIPGLYPFSDASPAEDNDNFIIKFGDAKLKINSDGTYCFHSATNELINVLNDLITAIKTSTFGGFPIDPASLANIDLIQARLQTFLGDC